MRIAREAPRRIGNADLIKQIENARTGGAAAQAAMQLKYFPDLLLDCVQRIQRRHRLLEYDGNIVAADVTDIALKQAQQFLSFECDLAGWVARHRIGQEL